jgi:hypothetical protein
MVMAKLHIICGNCGCNDAFEYDIVTDTDWDENNVEYEYQRVSIYCENCSTIHSLEDNAKERKKMKKQEIKVGDKVYVDGHTSMAQQNAHEAVVEEIKPQFNKDTGNKFFICRVGDDWYKIDDGSCYSNEKSMYYIEFTTEEFNIDVHAINGNEIIDFLNNESLNNDELEDITIEPGSYKFYDQAVSKGTYYLSFSADYNNWGESQPQNGNEIHISKDGVVALLCEAFESDGCYKVLEKYLTEWIKTHEFNKIPDRDFHNLLTEASNRLSGVTFEDKKELELVIELLTKARTYIK